MKIFNCAMTKMININKMFIYKKHPNHVYFIS